MDTRITLNLLAEIAAMEEELGAAEATLAHHLTRTRDLRELQAEYEEDAALARRGNQDAGVRLRGKENEIRAAEAALALRREGLVGCTDRRQYEAIKREISGLEQKLAGLEDEAFALLAEVEEAEEARREAETDQSRQEDRGGAEIARLSEEAEAAQRTRDDLKVKLDDKVKMLPDAIRRHVVRLQKNSSRAVAVVNGGACGGCFAQLPAQLAVDAEKGRALVKCSGCARYVVHRPWR